MVCCTRLIAVPHHSERRTKHVTQRDDCIDLSINSLASAVASGYAGRMPRHRNDEPVDWRKGRASGQFGSVDLGHAVRAWSATPTAPQWRRLAVAIAPHMKEVWVEVERIKGCSQDQ